MKIRFDGEDGEEQVLEGDEMITILLDFLNNNFGITIEVIED